MDIICYYEFFLDSMRSFLTAAKISTVLLPAEMENKMLYFIKSDNGETVMVSVRELLGKCGIKYELTDDKTRCDKEIALNFLRVPGMPLSGCSLKIKEFNNGNLKTESEEFDKKRVKDLDGYNYIISKEKRGAPYIIIFNAYDIGFDIWRNIYNGLSGKYNVIILSGDYDRLKDPAGGINKIVEKENVENAAALSWCSGFKAFLKFSDRYPGSFHKLFSLTGNYNLINGVSMLSGYEQSIISILKLAENEENKIPLDKIFPFFLKKQGDGTFGIPEGVMPVISQRLINNEALSHYLHTVANLSKFDIGCYLEGIKIPMINFIACNDHISLFESNRAVNGIKKCTNIILNFATHWCLWTHAFQILKVIDKEMEELL